MRAKTEADSRRDGSDRSSAIPVSLGARSTRRAHTLSFCLVVSRLREAVMGVLLAMGQERKGVQGEAIEQTTGRDAL